MGTGPSRPQSIYEVAGGLATEAVPEPTCCCGVGGTDTMLPSYTQARVLLPLPQARNPLAHEQGNGGGETTLADAFSLSAALQCGASQPARHVNPRVRVSLSFILGVGGDVPRRKKRIRASQ